MVLLHALPSYLDCRLLWRQVRGTWASCTCCPEVRDPRFDEFHRQRTGVRTAYHDLSRRVLAELDPPGPDALDIGVDGDVVFRLVETLPNLRVDGLGVPDQPARTADLAVHLLGVAWRLGGAARGVAGGGRRGGWPAVAR